MTEPPFIPSSGPLPVQPLAYSVPLRAGRPGVLTAMGVMSIVVASLSGLFSLSLGSQAVAFYFMSRAGGATATPAPPVPATPPAGIPGPATAPADGDPPAAPNETVAVAVTVYPSAPPATQPSPPLTTAEVQSIIQRVQARSGNRLNPAQVAALQAELQSPTQSLVLPGTAWSPLQSATMQPDGSVFIQMSGGFTFIDAQGKVASQSSNANPFAGFGRPTTITPFILVGADALLSLMLAVALMVAGILVFANSPKARPLHRVYAWLKIPVAVTGAVGFGWMYQQVLGNFVGGSAGAGYIFTTYAAAIGLLGVAYPVAVLITLRARSVRGYYQSAVEDR